MITVDWGNYEESLLVMIFVSKWSLDDYHDAIKQAYQLGQSKPYPIAFMVDMRRSSGAPHGFLYTSYQYARMQPNNTRCMVIISKSTIWQKLWQTALLIYGPIANSNVIFVDSVDKAYEITVSHLEVNDSS